MENGSQGGPNVRSFRVCENWRSCGNVTLHLAGLFPGAPIRKQSRSSLRSNCAISLLFGFYVRPIWALFYSGHHNIIFERIIK